MNRIKSIKSAKNLWLQGVKVECCPNKSHPRGVWTKAFLIPRYQKDYNLETREMETMDADFEAFCNNVKYYNCCNELGNYLAFYTEESIDDNYLKKEL